MRGGHSSVDQMSCLLKVVYLAYFLGAAGMERFEIEVFRAAEAALEHTVTRAEQGEGWSLPDADHVVLERVLALYDRQTASVPAHLFETAWQRLQHFIRGDSRSPLPASPSA